MLFHRLRHFAYLLVTVWVVVAIILALWGAVIGGSGPLVTIPVFLMVATVMVGVSTSRR
jgi:hypothetical protein